MELLINPIQPYAWGSHTAIAALQGRDWPTEQPEAELWLGAHPSAPSRFAGDGRSLAGVVVADPADMLGPDVYARFGDRLPYLLKVLAADAPLSIQVHPNAEQARLGFAGEEAAGIPVDDARRNYRDPHHKPELLYALTEFDALCGFRPVAETTELLRRLNVPALDDYADQLLTPGGLRAVFTELLSLGDPSHLVKEVIAACHRVLSASAAGSREYGTAIHIADRYPEDIGVVVTLFLNKLRLAPGGAIFVPAGVPHAYLAGVGIEIMANSDNVLRGGLTHKHMDVPELLRLVRFDDGVVTPVVAEPAASPANSATAPATHIVRWRTPAPEFMLTRVQLTDSSALLPDPGPRIVLCVNGAVRAADSAGGADLASGQAAFSAAGGGAITVTGTGTLFQASVPASEPPS